MEEGSGERIVNNPRRPSGASLSVLKTFESASDCEAQYRITMAAPPTVALPVEPMSVRSFCMPLARAFIPMDAFADFAGCFERLWREPSRRGACSRTMYNEYVTRRLGPESSTLRAKLRNRLYDRIQDAFSEIVGLPITQNAFVHGDATLSNAVLTGDGVRLIDFSPRPMPPELEIDLSKLMFSAIGFDTEGARSRALWREVERLMRSYRPDLMLMKYYLLTHAARVASREPPTTPLQIEFYEKVQKYAEAL